MEKLTAFIHQVVRMGSAFGWQMFCYYSNRRSQHIFPLIRCLRLLTVLTRSDQLLLGHEMKSTLVYTGDDEWNVE